MAKVSKSVAAFSCPQLLSKLRAQQGSQNPVLNALLAANTALNVAERGWEAQSMWYKFGCRRKLVKNPQLLFSKL